MFQLDRLVFATSQPEEVHKYLTVERGYSLVATGASFPGIATRIYPFTGGGFLEVAYIEDKDLVTQTEGGQALKTYLEEHGDGFHTFVLETDELDRVSRTLQDEGYPVQETPIQHIIDPTGEKVSFRMVGSFGHLPWFIQYDKRRPSPIGFPHAAIIRTTTLTADVALLEKLIQSPATVINYPNTHAAVIPLTNASLRIESGDEYGFGYLEPKGLLLENSKEASTPAE